MALTDHTAVGGLDCPQRTAPGQPWADPPGRAARGVAGAVKAVVDVTGALLLLLLVAPVLLVVAVAVAADGGPVLFRQTRVGRGGREFRMVKFRSMTVDAEARRAALLAADDGAGPLFKMRDDPRTTPVGALLRRWSLDELPQLLNVVAGSMWGPARHCRPRSRSTPRGSAGGSPCARA